VKRRAKYGKGSGIWRKRNGNDKIINGNENKTKEPFPTKRKTAEEIPEK
jgi:hypothetical protein